MKSLDTQGLLVQASQLLRQKILVDSLSPTILERPKKVTILNYTLSGTSVFFFYEVVGRYRYGHGLTEVYEFQDRLESRPWGASSSKRSSQRLKRPVDPCSAFATTHTHLGIFTGEKIAAGYGFVNNPQIASVRLYFSGDTVVETPVINGTFLAVQVFDGGERAGLPVDPNHVQDASLLLCNGLDAEGKVIDSTSFE